MMVHHQYFSAAAGPLRRSLSIVDDDLDSITLWVTCLFFLKALDIRIIIYRVSFVRVSSISMQRMTYIHFSLKIAIIRYTRPPWADQNLVAVTERPNKSMETPLFWRKWKLFGNSRLSMSWSAFDSLIFRYFFFCGYRHSKERWNYCQKDLWMHGARSLVSHVSLTLMFYPCSSNLFIFHFSSYGGMLLKIVSD